VEIPTMLSMELTSNLASVLGWSATRDLLVIKDRCKHEGLSFLTITLPILSDALERGLEEGRLTCPTSFSRHGALPRFLGGLFKRVFSPSGVVLPEPCVDSISAIRQICRFQKKLRIGCSPSRERSATLRFKKVEEELFHVSTSLRVREDFVLDSVSSVLWSQVYPEVDPEDLVCKHGPGVTADRKSANGRLSIDYWYDRFEHTFPVSLHAFHNFGAWSDQECISNDSGHTIRELGVSDEIPVRVVFVPKTLKSPRVIAIEPSSMQYVQQSMMHYMVTRLESHPLTRNSVRFSDQSVNQSLAQSASIDRRLATIDMSDASDRVSLSLVQRIFRSSGIIEYLEDARSLSADLPDGSNVVLSKYASMGSALCFPVEACVFYTLLLSALHTFDRVRPSTRSIKRYSRLIDVYGDDIIIPVHYVDFVVGYLESYALKVNEGKSFRNSLFRESCGGDFFNGISVKPVYVREDFTSLPTTWTPNQVMSAVSLANQLYEAGYWKVCQYVRDLVETAVKSRVPVCQFPGSGVYFSSRLSTTQCFYNRRLHGWQQKRVVYEPVKTTDRMHSAAGAFNKCFSITRRHTSEDPTFLKPLWDITYQDFESSVKRGGFRPKRRWINVS